VRTKITTDLSMLVDKISGPVTSDGLAQLLSQIEKTIGKVEGRREKVIDHTFRQAILLILIWSEKVNQVLLATPVNSLHSSSAKN